MDGWAHPGFEPVADAFRANFAKRNELGASVCLYANGEPVVDLWGGHADVARTRPWQGNTMVLVFSATKGLTATLVHRLIEQGELDLDAPVAHYWPEFAAEGKDAITLRWVLSHRAGLAAIDAPLGTAEVLAGERTLFDAIAAQKPNWEPGAAHGYHPRTFGWILGEVVRRVRGESLGTVFAKEMAKPFGLDFHIGVPAHERARVAEIVPPEPSRNPAVRLLQDRFMGPGTLLGRALGGPGELSYGPIWNSPELLAAEMPSSNGVGTARSVARHYAMLIGDVGGKRLLDPGTVNAARAVASRGRDRTIRIPTTFGLGYMLPPTLGAACGARSFGHPGAGGALGFADPERGLALAYTMNRMTLGLTGDDRSQSLVEAAYGCL